MKINFDNYLFRASGLGNLLTNPIKKDEVLSETTKTYLRELWIAEVFDRRKYVANKFTSKGIACESDSLDLVKEVTGKTYFKNQKEYSNDFIKGTPDVVSDDFILDIKTSWDIFTFSSVTLTGAMKDYYGQMLGYMLLTGKEKAKLTYCLVTATEDIIQEELRRLSYSFPEIDQSEEAAAKYRKNYEFDDIPAAMRMKQFELPLDVEVKEKLYTRIEASRAYMNSLSL